jgi:hypothetical protein
MRSRWCAGLLLLGLVPTHARAEGSELERAKESFRAGAAAYAAGEYLAAIQALSAAYELTPLPAIAFSLAQAERRQYFVDHERSHLEHAITLFRRYIEQIPSGGRRSDALDALAQLEPLAAVFSSSKPRAAEAEAVRRTRVVVVSETPGARVSLDGAPPSPAPLIREVSAGKHAVEVSARGFVSARREISAVDGELMFASVPLREYPSTLVIWSPENSELYIDGSFVTQGGAHVTLQLPSGKHRVAVGLKGHLVERRLVDLERGKAQSIRITLKPTPQRLASQALFIAGGAAFGADLVLSALAIRAQNRAEEFLGRRAQENVSSADLFRYGAAVAERDRYRLASAIGLASAGGLFITGLFLHELDQPNLQRLSAAGPLTESERPPPDKGRSSRLRFTPLVGAAQVGAALDLSF